MANCPNVWRCYPRQQHITRNKRAVLFYLLWSHDWTTHISQGCVTGAGATVWLAQHQWSNPKWYGLNGQVVSHSKTQQNANRVDVQCTGITFCACPSPLAGRIHIMIPECAGNPLTFQWRHYERDGVSNHQPSYYLLNRVFEAQIKENIKVPRHHVTGLCAGISPSQRASNAENVSISWKSVTFPTWTILIPVTSSLYHDTLRIVTFERISRTPVVAILVLDRLWRLLTFVFFR